MLIGRLEHDSGNLFGMGVEDLSQRIVADIAIFPLLPLQRQRIEDQANTAHISDFVNLIQMSQHQTGTFPRRSFRTEPLRLLDNLFPVKFEIRIKNQNAFLFQKIHKTLQLFLKSLTTTDHYWTEHGYSFSECSTYKITK